MDGRNEIAAGYKIDRDDSGSAILERDFECNANGELTFDVARPNTHNARFLGHPFDATESETLCMDRCFLCGNLDASLVPCGDHSPMGRSANERCYTADMDATEESDNLVVPSKRANKTETSVAESAEERGSTRGTVNQMTSSRTLSRNRRGVCLATACHVAWATDRHTQGRSRMR